MRHDRLQPGPRSADRQAFADELVDHMEHAVDANGEDRIRLRITLCYQHINLAKLSDNLFCLVSLARRFLSSSGFYTSSRTASFGMDQWR